MNLPSLALAVALLTVPLSAQRQVSIPISDPASGKTAQIQANLYGRGPRALLLAHGGRFNKESWKDQAPVFARAGFLVLAINFRGDHPNPDGSPGSYGSDAENAADVLAAVKYLHQHGVKSISAIGGSLGGDAVGNAQAQSTTGAFDRMVFLGSEGGDYPDRLRGRKLFIVARDDSSGSGPRLPSITRHYNQTPDPKQLIVLNGSAHAQFLFPTSEGPHLMRTLLGFLSHD
jgi:pimeloyl-ACP methyl ester carboxylesterase